MLAKLSVIGLYNYDDSIFDDMYLPAGMEKWELVNLIFDEAGELATRYPDCDLFKKMLSSWSYARLFTWSKIWALQSLDYNPIENYNRTDTETIEREDEKTAAMSGTVGDVYTGTGSGTDTGTVDYAAGTTDTESVTAFNSGAFQDARKNARGGKDTDTRNLASSYKNDSSNTRTYNTKNVDGGTQTETRVLNSKGNIGVTTTQQMMEQEITIAKKLDLYKIIVDEFVERFCVMVY